MKKSRIVVVLWLVCILTSFFAACSSGAGVTPACCGYAAGKGGEELSYRWHENDEMILPAEFVRCFALYTLGEDTDKTLALRILYDYDAVYMKSLLDKAGLSYDELVTKMNEKSKSEGFGFSFGSAVGTNESETALLSLLGKSERAYTASTGTLTGACKLAKAFNESPLLSELLSSGTAKFDTGAAKSRVAPLLASAGQYYLETAKIYLAGNAVKNGQTAYMVIAAVCDKDENGNDADSYAAVGIQCGNDSPIYYGAVDAGNLCGKVLGKNYMLSHLGGGEDVSGGGMTVGATIFKVIVLGFVAVAGVLLVIVIINGIITRAKRNVEGRKRYSAPRESEADRDNEAGQADKAEQDNDAPSDKE